MSSNYSRNGLYALVSLNRGSPFPYFSLTAPFMQDFGDIRFDLQRLIALLRCSTSADGGCNEFDVSVTPAIEARKSGSLT